MRKLWEYNGLEFYYADGRDVHGGYLAFMDKLGAVDRDPGRVHVFHVLISEEMDKKLLHAEAKTIRKESKRVGKRLAMMQAQGSRFNHGPLTVETSLVNLVVVDRRTIQNESDCWMGI